MSTLKQLGNDIGRALAVLSMVFLCFAAAPPDLPTAGVAQQAGVVTTLLTGLCGADQGQHQFACHAPNACCRTDPALQRPREILAEPAFRSAIAVAYPALITPASFSAANPGFRSRAPPV